jgi:hypothetical protein
MNYDQFKEVLNLPDFDPSQHAALVINSTVSDEEFMTFFSEHVKNIRVCVHSINYGKTYIIVNNDVTIDDSLTNYEIVVPLASNIISGDSV